MRISKRRSAVILVCLLVLPDIACDSEISEPPAEIDSLVGTSWVVTKFVASDGTRTDPGVADFFIGFRDNGYLEGMTFKDKMVFNFIGGAYSDSAGNIEMWDLAILTERYEPPGSRVHELARRLTLTAHFEGTVEMLRFEQSNGEALMLKGVDSDFLRPTP